MALTFIVELIQSQILSLVVMNMIQKNISLTSQNIKKARILCISYHSVVTVLNLILLVTASMQNDLACANELFGNKYLNN